MNGSNHQQAQDARPLHPCPACLRKLCWSLQAEPLPYLMKMKTFCEQNGLNSERNWYEKALPALATDLK